MPPALDVRTIVFSRLVSMAVRMMRLLIHWTIGGVRMMRSQRSRVVCSNSSLDTR